MNMFKNMKIPRQKVVIHLVGDEEERRVSTRKIVIILTLSYFLTNLIVAPYSTRFSYIPREKMVVNLLAIQNKHLPLVGLPPCSHNVTWNGARLDMPDWNVPVEFNKDGVESGEYYPKYCEPQYSTAIIVPYRDRSKHLEVLLPYLHNFLRRQEIHYRIFVVSQDFGQPWNKGKLFNLAVKVVKKLGYTCLVLHDVDMLPLHEANMFACSSQPRHMSASIDKHRYNLMYNNLVGGALAITTDVYETLNGYSNKFERWGGEDDEFANRILSENYSILRFHPEVSMYTMITHRQEPINPDRKKLSSANRLHYREDGLSNLSVKNVYIIEHPLYTNISVVL